MRCLCRRVRKASSGALPTVRADLSDLRRCVSGDDKVTASQTEVGAAQARHFASFPMAEMGHRKLRGVTS
ncbi:hypothetical protein BURKHO8Y_270028 [Burkholderia sp. 8Y]|nr:hypothetical protein BURKHO8Y_270028 [Burkholderia sp. 8Y]